MSETSEIVRVQAWSKSQGDFVEINKSDFNEKQHKLYEGKVPDGAPPKAIKISAAAKKKAEELGLDVTKIKGTGADGNITVDDVKNAEPAKIDFASDEAGELAIELGFDAAKLEEVEGTGEDGAITVQDLENFVSLEGNTE